MQALTGFKTETLQYSGLANWEAPSIMGPGLLYMRHAHAESMLLDPFQPGEFSLGGNAVWDGCFDKTSLLFQSSGSLEHTQVRKLWDEVGFDRFRRTGLSNVSSKHLGGFSFFRIIDRILEHRAGFGSHTEGSRAIGGTLVC